MSSTSVAGDGLPTASVCNWWIPEGCVINEAACPPAMVPCTPCSAALLLVRPACTPLPEIDSYNVSSVTTGDDAQGQASITARVDGAELTGSGTSPTDILEAPARDGVAGDRYQPRAAHAPPSRRGSPRQLDGSASLSRLRERAWGSGWLSSPERQAPPCDLLPRAGEGDKQGTHFMNAPSKTLFEKIWETHVVAGEPALLYIDLHLVHEVTSPQAFEGLRLAGRPVRRPDLTIATMDHNVPTEPRGRDPRRARAGAARGARAQLRTTSACR